MPSPRSVSTTAAVVLLTIDTVPQVHAIPLPTVLPNTATVWNLEGHNPAYTGTIPSEIARYTKLTEIWFNANSLTGTLPSELGKLTKMKSYFSMFSNQLNGQIPTQLGKVGFPLNDPRRLPPARDLSCAPTHTSKPPNP